MKISITVFAVIVLALKACVMPVYASVKIVDVPVADNNEIITYTYVGQGDVAFLWLPSESGVLEQEKVLAEKLAAAGIDVWLADLFSSYFLPTVASSIERIPKDDIASLIQFVRKKSGKRVYLVGPGKGALSALRGARTWQQIYNEPLPLAGAILISPKFFVETPEPGLEGELMSVVSSTNLPILILQPDKSPWYWQLKRTVPALESSGSDVYRWILHGIRDRFYYRPDAYALEDDMAAGLHDLLGLVPALLQPYSQHPRRQRDEQALKIVPAKSGKKERMLGVYQGDPNPPPLKLSSLKGSMQDLNDYKGRVVLVNYWASWCPPCVHEMPSMQRLKQRFKDMPFTILAVNMAEDEKTVQVFLKEKVSVDFTILMDYDGKALQDWKVVAFPTSYVLDKKGRIRYALFGAIDWESQDVINKMYKLIHE